MERIDTDWERGEEAEFGERKIMEKQTSRQAQIKSTYISSAEGEMSTMPPVDGDGSFHHRFTVAVDTVMVSAPV